MSNYHEPNPLSGLARSTDPATSHEAAASIDVRGHHAMILATMSEYGLPMASEQIAVEINLPEHAVNKRMSELSRRGYIRRTEQRHINESGRQAFRYVLSDTPS